MQRLIILLFLGLIAAPFAKSQSIESLSAKFSYTENKKQSETVVEGCITFCVPNMALIKTSSPYHQHMFVDGNVLIIHQDSSKTASQITAGIPHAIPYLSEFILATMEDFGLSALGCKVIDVQQRGDSLISTWTNEDDKKNRFYRITAINDHIIKVETSEDATYQSEKRIEFSNYKTVNGVNLPMQCRQITTDKKLIRTTLLDSVSVNSPNCNKPKFDLPAHVHIKKYEW